MSNENDHDIIETASATTSPDNSNSGPFAYVVTAIAAGLTLLLALGGAGCVSLALTAATDGYGMGYLEDMPYRDYDDFDDYDLDDMLERYREELTLLNQDVDANSEDSSVSIGDALDFDLAAYGPTLDSVVSASSYAGTPSEVRDFVRGMLKSDREYMDKLARCLDAAALNEDERIDKLEEATALCDEAGKAMDALELPTVAKDEDGLVKDQLGTACSAAKRRWDLLGREVALLQTGEEVDRARLWDVDDEILDITYECGEELEDAMSSAAKL